MPAERLDQATLRAVAKLLAAETDDFNALVRLAGLNPARDFRHTDLSGTSMAGADLRGFDFSGSDFRNVMLDGARIDGACFRNADLRGTDLSPAIGRGSVDCSFAVFQDVPYAPEMVLLPSGSFLMGSPEGEDGRGDDEGPQRRVIVASFAICRYPVTFAEYDHYCDATGRGKPDDEGWGRGLMPVINVSWDEAVAYAAWLSEQTGKPYRLPSEAEWEYACRAGTETAYWWGDAFDPAMANTMEGGPDRTTEVGSYPANPWGLFDTLGSTWEWAEDHYHSVYQDAPRDSRDWVNAAETVADESPRVFRGGSWFDNQDYVRCAFRTGNNPNLRLNFIGFRVVCAPRISDR